jgi:hypothetical protein
MKKKPQKNMRKSILQECEIVPITDPAEIAALERRIREAEKALDGRDYGKLRPRKRK